MFNVPNYEKLQQSLLFFIFPRFLRLLTIGNMYRSANNFSFVFYSKFPQNSKHYSNTNTAVSTNTLGQMSVTVIPFRLIFSSSLGNHISKTIKVHRILTPPLSFLLSSSFRWAKEHDEETYVLKTCASNSDWTYYSDCTCHIVSFYWE